MTPTSTPRADAVRAWLAAGDYSAPVDWPPEPKHWPNPPEWSDPVRRLEAALTMFASGAMAELPRFAVVNGRRIPAPPHRPPRAIRTKGRIR